MELQFQPFASAVEASFWHALSQAKVDVLKLSVDAVSVTGHYFTGASRSGGSSVDANLIPAHLCLPGSAIQINARSKSAAPPFAFLAPGSLYNANTVEEFCSMDKNQLFSIISEKIWTDIQSGEALKTPQLLNRFLLLTFADLKKYKFYYWFAFPAVQNISSITAGANWTLTANRTVSDVLSKPEMDSLYQLYTHHQNTEEAQSEVSNSTTLDADKQPTRIGYFILVQSPTHDAASLLLFPLHQLKHVLENHPLTQVYIGFADPSSLPNNPGWPLRNLLALVVFHLPTEVTGRDMKLQFLSYREQRIHRDISTSRILDIVFTVNTLSTDSKPLQQPKFVGWEKNNDKLAPRLADLAPMMDPLRLADTAVDLNLKLMKWRLLPELDLDKIQNTRCLLLGAGTLGCYVARSLLAWGIRHITFVDNAIVSFSNPVRQPLFLYEDCLQGGKPKAATAAEHLRKIYPGVQSEGHNFNIPMPGHPVTPQLVNTVKQQITTLSKLIQDHDAVFLLMDSRESRWLPSVMGCVYGKIVITTALGFDTYVVMRHGAIPKSTSNSASSKRLGCYFCNDVVAPTDSLKDRTLDQQCTVTRPGLSAMAAAQAVELLVSLVTHPQGVHASAEIESPRADDKNTSRSPLGICPHQIRGYIGRFTNLLVTGEAYNKCTACSDAIVTAFQSNPEELVIQACEDAAVLERITGLDKLHAETEAMDWVAENEEDDF